MTSAGRELEVWFLTGSQGLYGESVLREVAEQSAQVVRSLAAGAFGLELSGAGAGAGGGGVSVRLVPVPVLTDAEGVRRVCLAARASDACVGVIAWMHTFSPAKMWIAGLDALQKPLLHLHTQAGMELPWSTIDMDLRTLNQAAHGDP